MASQILESSTEGIFYRLSNVVASQTSVSTKDADIEPSIIHSLNNFKDDISLHINRIYGNIKYIDFLVPAVLGMTIMFSCMMGMGATIAGERDTLQIELKDSHNCMGATIAGERETGELARLFMTPTSVATIICGKIATKLLIELIRALILIIMAILLFNVSIKGGILQTFIVLVIGAVCFVSFGIFFSARTSTQEDYAQIVMPFSMPMMFVSGVFYPIETMPWILQKLAYIFPLTYLNNAMRAVMLKGQSLGDVWLDLVILIGFAILFFILDVKRFNRDV